MRIPMLAALLLLLAGNGVAGDATAPPVTEENLMASERFWPYHVKLVEAWQAEVQDRPLRAGQQGVLVRVENRESARIDFGRRGQFSVPIAETNLVEEAERVRRGERQKMGPNFVLSLGPRMLAPSEAGLIGFSYEKALEYAGFLCVFADPSAEGFGDLAAALAPLQARANVLTILLPQGRNADAAVNAHLLAVGWRVPFVLSHLTAPYTESLLGASPPGDEADSAAVTLQTNEGRLLFASSWSEDTPSSLVAVLDREFGSASAPLDRVVPAGSEAR